MNSTKAFGRSRSAVWATVFLTAAVMSIGLIFAKETPKCFDFYGREIECPVVNKRFSIEKKVKLATEDDSQYRDQIDKVLNGQVLNYKIVITNTGEVSVDDLKLVDFLPENHVDFQLDDKLTREGDTLRFVFGDNFDPGEREVLLFSATASVEGLDPGEKKCVVNKAQIYRDRNNNNVIDSDEAENADTTTVCIVRGSVKGEQPPQLPETAAGGLQLILGAIGTLGSGVFLTRKIAFK